MATRHLLIPLQDLQAGRCKAGPHELWAFSNLKHWQQIHTCSGAADPCNPSPTLPLPPQKATQTQSETVSLDKPLVVSAASVGGSCFTPSFLPFLRHLWRLYHFSHLRVAYLSRQCSPTSCGYQGLGVAISLLLTWTFTAIFNQSINQGEALGPCNPEAGHIHPPPTYPWQRGSCSCSMLGQKRCQQLPCDPKPHAPC